MTPLIGQRPKSLLVGTPAGDQMLTGTAQCIEALLLVWRSNGGSGGWMPTQGTYPCMGQNAIAQTALDRKADYMLLIDSDMTFEPSIVQKLVARQRDIVAAPYRSRNYRKRLGRLLDGSEPTGAETGCREMEYMPTGMMLVAGRVLRALPYPRFFVSYGERQGDFVTGDVNFCRSARKVGFSVWCDFDLAPLVVHNGTEPIRWQ